MIAFQRDTIIEAKKLRKILSGNIKKYRKLLGLSQERLAEVAELSAQTVNDIEGCRTWVSDKTIVKLAQALHIEAYQLLFPNNEAEKVFPVLTPAMILQTLQENIKKAVDREFDEVLRTEMPEQ
jgi:transcriptional regulator with XRE-family HTH domain